MPGPELRPGRNGTTFQIAASMKFANVKTNDCLFFEVRRHVFQARHGASSHTAKSLLIDSRQGVRFNYCSLTLPTQSTRTLTRLVFSDQARMAFACSSVRSPGGAMPFTHPVVCSPNSPACNIRSR